VLVHRAIHACDAAFVIGKNPRHRYGAWLCSVVRIEAPAGLRDEMAMTA
jgi:hypothetical protein